MKKQKVDLVIKYLAICTLLFGVYFFLLPGTGHDFDNFCWKQWSKFLLDHKLGKIYFSGTDYLPLYHYILYIFAKIQGSVEKIDQNIEYLRLFTLVFFFINGFYFFRILHDRFKSVDKAMVNTLFYLINISVLYNVLIWGQVDEIMTCFVFLSFYYAFNKKILGSILFFVLALNFKLQSIIFLPLIGIILLPEIIRAFSFRKLLKWIGLPIVLQILILLPFIINGTTGQVWKVVSGSVGKYPVISMNAYNIWVLLIHSNLMSLKDYNTFLGITYRNIGLLLFFAASFVALFPLLKSKYLEIFKNTHGTFSFEKLVIIGALIPLLFFYFNTQMHERYSHPAFIFLILYSILSKNPLPAILGSLAYLLNLDAVQRSLDFQNYGVFIFSQGFISVLYLITIVWLFLSLYDIKFKKNAYE